MALRTECDPHLLEDPRVHSMGSDDVFKRRLPDVELRSRAMAPRHPEAGSSWPSWPRSSYIANHVDVDVDGDTDVDVGVDIDTDCLGTKRAWATYPAYRTTPPPDLRNRTYDQGPQPGRGAHPDVAVRTGYGHWFRFVVRLLEAGRGQRLRAGAHHHRRERERASDRER